MGYEINVCMYKNLVGEAEGLGVPQPGYFSLWSNTALYQGSVCGADTSPINQC